MKTIHKFATAFFLLVNLLSLPAIADQNHFETEILRQINTYRASKTLPPLQLNEAITAVATQHSEEMASKAIPFSHQGFDKRTALIFSQLPRPKAIAENIALTYDNPLTVVNLWLKSPLHKKNIEGDYNLTGIGVAYDKNGHPYVTQIFVRTF